MKNLNLISNDHKRVIRKRFTVQSFYPVPKKLFSLQNSHLMFYKFQRTSHNIYAAYNFMLEEGLKRLKNLNLTLYIKWIEKGYSKKVYSQVILSCTSLQNSLLMFYKFPRTSQNIYAAYNFMFMLFLCGIYAGLYMRHILKNTWVCILIQTHVLIWITRIMCQVYASIKATNKKQEHVWHI